RRPGEGLFRTALGGLGQKLAMNKYLRVAAVVSCLGVLVLGAVALDPAGPLLSSFQGCAAKRLSMAELNAQSEQLKRREEAWLRRIEAKERIAQEVIAGRRSLAEAMKRFHTLDQEWPPFSPGAPKAQVPEISEDGWDGRIVLIYVRRVLADRPE